MILLLELLLSLATTTVVCTQQGGVSQAEGDHDGTGKITVGPVTRWEVLPDSQERWEALDENTPDLITAPSPSTPPQTVYERFVRGVLLEDRIFACLEFVPQLLAMLIFAAANTSISRAASKNRNRRNRRTTYPTTAAKTTSSSSSNVAASPRRRNKSQNTDDVNSMSIHSSWWTSLTSAAVLERDDLPAVGRSLLTLGLGSARYRAITRLAGVFICFTSRTLNRVFHRDFGVWSWYRDALEVLAWVCDILFAVFEAPVVGATYGLLPRRMLRFDDHASYMWFWSIVCRLINTVHNVVYIFLLLVREGEDGSGGSDTAVRSSYYYLLPFTFAHKTEKMVPVIVLITFVFQLAQLGVAISYLHPEGPQTLLPSTSGNTTKFSWWDTEGNTPNSSHDHEKRKHDASEQQKCSASSASSVDKRSLGHHISSSKSDLALDAWPPQAAKNPPPQCHQHHLRLRKQQSLSSMDRLSPTTSHKQISSGGKSRESMNQMRKTKKHTRDFHSSPDASSSDVTIAKTGCRVNQYLWYFHRFLIVTQPSSPIPIGSHRFFFFKGMCGTVAAVAFFML